MHILQSNTWRNPRAFEHGCCFSFTLWANMSVKVPVGCEKKRIKAVTAAERCDGVFTQCHSKVNISPSANWLQHHSTELLEATTIRLSAMWQLSLPVQQHVGADGNISKRDDIRYSLIRSLSLLQGLYFYTTLNTILYLCISVQRVCTNPKVPQHKLGNVSSDEWCNKWQSND